MDPLSKESIFLSEEAKLGTLSLILFRFSGDRSKIRHCCLVLWLREFADKFLNHSFCKAPPLYRSPAINGNYLPCDITRRIRGQVNNGPHHLLGIGWPRQRSSAHCHFKDIRVFPKGFAEASFGQAWSNGVYPDIVWCPLLSHHLCGHNYAGLAYGVNGQ